MKMGLFRGQFYNNEPQNHLFVTNHPAMAYAGLRSFNLNLINQFSQDPTLASNVFKAFGRFGIRLDRNAFNLGGSNQQQFLFAIKLLLELGDESRGNLFRCNAFDLDSRTFSERKFFVEDVINLLHWYEYTWLPSDQDKNGSSFNADYYRDINAIKNSQEKYLEHSRPIVTNSKFWYGAPNPSFRSWEQGLGGSMYLRLYFADKNVLKSSRIIVDKGPPKFADIPRRPTGAGYSQGKTDKNKTGVYNDASQSDSRDPEDAVVADVRMSFNPALGKWEVQNQILARLLTDVDPAPIQSVALDANDVDSIPAEDFYDTTNDKYLGQFSTGLAMPLSSENGNPHMFGPNLIQCSDGTTCEKIRVFNRANKTYAKGQLVICHLIGNEWIIQDFGADLEAKPTAVGVGTWQFGKYITNNNNHFREQSPPEEENGDFKRGLPIRPSEWEELLRYQFYNKYNFTLAVNKVPTALINIPNVNNNARLNTGIIQSSIFDQYDNGQQFVKINPEGEGLDPSWPDVCPMYWGPVFNGGYAKNVKALGAIGEKYKPDVPLNEDYDANVPGYFKDASDLISFDSMGPSLGSDRESIRSPHLPPEVAVNGPWGDFSSPIESYHVIANKVNNGDYSFMTNGQHYHYSYPSGQKYTGETFALKPNDPTQVTFISLAGEFAAADDFLAQEDIMLVGYKNDRSFYTKARNFGVGNVGMGRALYRGDPDVATYDSLGPVNLIDPTKLEEFEAEYKTELRNYVTVPYDYYVQSKFDNAVFGPNDAYIASDGDDQGAECQGIITARTKLFRSGGGAVNFETVNNYGLVGTVTATVVDSTLSVLPLFPPVALGGGGSFTPNDRSRVWGNAEQGPENFGLTGLHVQIFDYWPPDQTLYIAPYFTILHFNAGIVGSGPMKETKYFKSKDNKINYSEPVAGTPDQQVIDDEGLLSTEVEVKTYDIDVRIPTYTNGRTVGYLTSIDADTQLRPEAYWNVSTDARGLMLTGGGAVSSHLAIGVASDNAEILEAGEGFEAGQSYTSVSKNVMIQVTKTDANGQITGFVFSAKDADGFSNGNLGRGNPEQGENISPSDFPLTLAFISGATGGVTARIKFPKGEIYRKEVYHRGPERYTPNFRGTRLSQSSGRGDQYIRGAVKNTSITLDDNSSYHPYPGEYEAFFYFHNDITHTFMGGTILNSNPYLQYIKLTIS